MRPSVSPFTEDVYAALEPLAGYEEENDYALLKFLDAFCSQQQEIEDLVRDKADGTPGWASLLDLDNAPSKALGFIAQFVGVQLRAGLSDASQRDRIRSTDGQWRGTIEALRGAARQYLIGGQNVVIRERDGSPYRLTVITYTSQTPDHQQVLDALLEQKPGGLILNYEVLTGWDYQQVVNSYAGKHYFDLVTDWGAYTYGDFRDNVVSMG